MENLEINQTLTYPTDYDDGTNENKFNEFIDEDIEKNCIKKTKSDKNKLTLKNASIEIFNTIIQIDFIVTPILFFLNGFIPSIFIILIIYYLQMGSLNNILHCKKITSRYTLTVYGRLIFGLKGKYFVQILCLIKPIIICCICLLVLNKIFIHLFVLLLEFLFGGNYIKREILSLIFISIIFFMLYWKRFSINKSTFNFFYLTTLFFTIMNSFIYLLYCIIKRKINWDEFNGINFGAFNFYNIIKGFGICLFTFTYQSKIFKTYLSLKVRNAIEMKNSVHFGFLTAICLISFIGYTNSFNIKNNNYNDLIDKLFFDIGNYNSYILKILIIIQLILIFILSSFYLITISIYLRKKVNSLIREYSKKFIEEEKTETEKREKEEEIEKKLVILNIIMFLFLFIFSFYFKNLGSIVYFFGVGSSNCLSIIVPAIFVILLKKETFFTKKCISEKVSLVVGMFFIFSSIILFFMNFKKKIRKIEK